MPLDRMALLGWMVAREREEPGTPISGRDLMPRAATLCRDDPTPWNAVARAAGELYQLGCLTWRYVLYPGESSVPPPHLINDRSFQQVDGVMVTSVGYGMFANASSCGGNAHHDIGWPGRVWEHPEHRRLLSARVGGESD